jgi:DNA-binding winged helix-turn-helix (wHTH) protein
VSYSFGAFVLDEQTRQLLHDGREIHLSPKAFELLRILVHDRPRAVSKAELQERLWPSTFVEETNIAGLVAEIRRALGDPAASPIFVRTVHRFGYRFVAQVEEPAARTATSARARPCLVIDNRQVVLLEGASVIGRAPDATIQCDVAGVSRYHARILVAGDSVTLEDLGSKNGTYVQRQRVTSMPLTDGDEIRVGRASLVFRIARGAAATETISTTVER